MVKKITKSKISQGEVVPSLSLNMKTVSSMIEVFTIELLVEHLSYEHYC